MFNLRASEISGMTWYVLHQIQIPTNLILLMKGNASTLNASFGGIYIKTLY